MKCIQHAAAVPLSPTSQCILILNVKYSQNSLIHLFIFSTHLPLADDRIKLYHLAPCKKKQILSDNAYYISLGLCLKQLEVTKFFIFLYHICFFYFYLFAYSFSFVIRCTFSSLIHHYSVPLSTPFHRFLRLCSVLFSRHNKTK